MKVPACHHPSLPPALDSHLGHHPRALGARPAAAQKPSARGEHLAQALGQPCSTVIKDQTWDPEEGERGLASGVKIKGLPQSLVTKIRKSL